MTTSHPLKHDLALLFTVGVWGFNFAVVKAVFEVMPPHAMNIIRFIIAGITLGGVYFWQQRRIGETFLDPLQRHLWHLMTLGLLGFLLYQLCFIIGLDHTTAGSAALIMAGTPLWTAVLGALFRFDILRGWAWAGLLTTFAGTAVIVLGSTKEIDFSNETFFGNMLMLAASFLWGAYTAFNKPLSLKESPVSIAFWGLMFAFPFLMLIGFPYLDGILWPEVTAWTWAALLFSGGLSTGLTIAIWNTSVKEVGPSQTAAFGNLTPVIALISGVLLLGETITLIQVVGGLLIIGGLLVMRRQRLAPVPATT